MKGSNKRNVIPNSFPQKEEFVNNMEAIRLAQLEEKKKVKKMDVKIDEEGKQVFDFEVGESGTTGVLKQEKKYEGLTAKDIDEAEELIDPEGV